MTEKHLHIVSFDVPFPADYGGAIDVYYRIKALHSLGFKIILHCFEYGRGKQAHLDEICEQVFYYHRPKTLLQAFNKRPFIVASRASKELLNRLLLDEHPILFEGLHTTWFLEHPAIQKRMTYVRTHNIEHDYYQGLADKTPFPRRIYFQQEAKKLKRYESVLKLAKHILCIRKGDLEHFRQYNQQVSVLPASLPKMSNSAYCETEKYVLFHGNLSVSENEEAVKWIIENLWKKDSSLPRLKIAGKNPSKALIELTAACDIELIANPNDEVFQQLLQKARIHLLISHQSTGVKLKLLNALQTSGHVLVNPEMVAGTDLGEMCIICSSPKEFISKINEIGNLNLDISVYQKRQSNLQTHYNTLENCRIFENSKIPVGN